MYKVCVKDESLCLIELQSFHSEFQNLENSFETKGAAECVKKEVKLAMKKKNIPTRPVCVVLDPKWKEEKREERRQAKNIKMINPNANKVETVIEGQDPLAF